MTSQSQITLVVDFAGEGNGVVPRMCRLYCPDNTLAEITAAAFLDNYLHSQNIALLATDFVAAVASDGHQWYKPVFTDGSCQLTVLP